MISETQKWVRSAFEGVSADDRFIEGHLWSRTVHAWWINNRDPVYRSCYNWFVREDAVLGYTLRVVRVYGHPGESLRSDVEFEDRIGRLATLSAMIKKHVEHLKNGRLPPGFKQGDP